MILYLILWIASALAFVFGIYAGIEKATDLWSTMEKPKYKNIIKHIGKNYIFSDVMQFVLFFAVLYFVAYLCITATFTTDWIPNVPDKEQCPINRQWFQIMQHAKFGKYAGTICFGM
jgi:hypothetical protein